MRAKINLSQQTRGVISRSALRFGDGSRTCQKSTASFRASNPYSIGVRNRSNPKSRHATFIMVASSGSSLDAARAALFDIARN